MLVSNFILNTPEQKLNGLFAQHGGIDIHNGQRWVHIFCQGIVIEGHNADLLRHRQMQFLAGFQQTKGRQIVIADKGVGMIICFQRVES